MAAVDGDRRVRVGLIGAGWVACDRHLPSLARIGDVDIVGVADGNLANAQKAASKFGIGRAVRTLDELLQLGVDAVSICTPPWTHAELAVQALSQGAHVFTEKPMAMTEGDARTMADAATRNDRILCVSHNFLWSRSVRKADHWLAGETVEYGLGLQASSPQRRLPTWIRSWPAGIFRDESPHLLYVLQHFLGTLSLDAVRTRPSRTGDEHPAGIEVLVRGTRGSGQMTMQFEAPVSEWHVGLMGANQVIDLDLFRDIAVRVPSDGAHKAADIARSSARVVGGHLGGFAASGARLLTGRQRWGHDVLIAAFIDAVRTGGPSPVAVDDAVSIVRITDQIVAEVVAPSARSASS